METLKDENIIYVSSNDDLKTVLSCFKVNRISHIPVMNNNEFIGMISKTDVVEFLHDNIEELNPQTFSELVQNTKAKQLMIQPLVEATTDDTEMTLLEKLLSHQVSSVIIKNDTNAVVGIVTEKDMLKYLTRKTEQNLSFGEKLGLHVVQWLDKNGIIKASRVLADIGI